MLYAPASLLMKLRYMKAKVAIFFCQADEMKKIWCRPDKHKNTLKKKSLNWDFDMFYACYMMLWGIPTR